MEKEKLEPTYGDDEKEEIVEARASDNNQSSEKAKSIPCDHNEIAANPKTPIKFDLIGKIVFAIGLVLGIMAALIILISHASDQTGYYRSIDQRGDTIIGLHRINPNMVKEINCYRLIYKKRKLAEIETIKAGRLHNSLPISPAAKTVIEDIPGGKKFINKDVYNKPVADMQGICFYTVKNRDKNSFTLTRYDRNGKVAGGWGDLSQMISTLDDKGRVTTSRLFNSFLKRIRNKKNEVYEMRNQYDKDDNLIESSFYNQMGELVNDQFGVAIYRYQHDEFGHELQTSCFGTDGELKNNERFGVSITRKKYDQHNNLIEISNYGINDQLRKSNDGFAIMRFKYNDLGDWVEVGYYGSDEKPIEMPDGIARHQHKFDEAGNMIEDACYGADGKAKEDVGGVAIYRRTYDRRGNNVEMRFYGVDGNLKENRDGIATVRYMYDGNDNLIEISQYNISNVLTEDKSGVAVREFKYDEIGNTIRYAQYDAKKQLKGDQSGIAIQEMSYDANRNMVEMRTFGVDQHLRNNITGAAAQCAKYDSNHNVIESKGLNAQGQLIAVSGGIAIWRYKYDENHEKIEESFYGLDDNLVADGSGIAIYRYKRDPAGNIIESRLYGTDGELKNGPEGFAVYRAKYDNAGKAIEESYYDVDNKPVTGPGHYDANRLQRNVSALLGSVEKQKCITNLRQIGGAIQVWAIDTGASSTSVPRISDIVGSYLKEWPDCKGIPYRITRVDEDPKCPNDIPGHVIE